MARVERRRTETTSRPVDLYKEWKWAAWGILAGGLAGGAIVWRLMDVAAQACLIWGNR